MTSLLIVLLPPLLGLERASDPTLGLFGSTEEVRLLECARLSQARAHQLHPGQVPDLPARDLAGATGDALLCGTRLMRPGERPARDEAILSSLRRTVGEITQLAAALQPGAVTWHVDAFYPQPAVAAKIAVAARTDLAERGHRVSDRAPVLAAGDVAILGRLPAPDSYALACARYLAHRALGEGDALLALMIIDARETRLHAGVCLRGAWRWLR